MKGKLYKIVKFEKELKEVLPDLNLFTIDQDLRNADGYIYEINLYLEGLMQPVSISFFHTNKLKNKRGIRRIAFE